MDSSEGPNQAFIFRFSLQPPSDRVILGTRILGYFIAAIAKYDDFRRDLELNQQRTETFRYN